MKSLDRTAKLAACLTIAAATTSLGTIIDQWDFTYPDDTGLGAALSNNGTNLGGNSPLASVQGNELQFISTNIDGTGNLSTFRATGLSVDPITTGLIEASWTYTSANMSATDAADGSGRVGFGMRDIDPSNDDLGLVRLLYNGTLNQFNLQYTDDLTGFTSVATFPGSSLTDLSVRLQIDLDNTGAAGSFQVWYTESGGSEVHAVTDGQVVAGGQVDQFRTIQQVTNGGTDWRQGDTITVDNLTVEIIPEPTTAALLALAGGALALWRRRR